MKNDINYGTRSIKYAKEDLDIKEESVEEEEIKESNPIFKKILFAMIVIVILFVSYAGVIEPKLLEVKEYKVESSILPDTFHGLKIIQISDINYGTSINKKQLDKIVNQVNDLKPDLIFFTGNLIDKNIVTSDEIVSELVESLRNLKPSLYKYAIYGDVDILNSKYKDIITEADFKLLDNESVLLYYKGVTPIQITGFNSMETNPDYSLLANLVDGQDTTNFYKIVLTHEPDSFDYFKSYKPNLVLSGHSLGGLIQFPFVKPLFLDHGATNYYKDYYRIDTTDLFVSSGLGTSGINARFNNRPSINLYRL